MLAAVTLFALWLGHELDKVRERDRLIRTPAFLRFFEYRLNADQLANLRRHPERDSSHIKIADRPPPSSTIPYLWKLVGDKAIEDMDLFLPAGKFTAREVRRFQALFPECAVTVLANSAEQSGE